MFLVRVRRRIQRARHAYIFSRRDSDRQPLIEAPTPTLPPTSSCSSKKVKGVKRRQMPRGGSSNMKRLLARMKILVGNRWTSGIACVQTDI